jgi:hypothetical protein
MESKTDFKGINKKSRDRVRELFQIHSIAVEDKTAVKHNQFLALLKSRYGYSNDKAVVELERLVRQFYTANESLGVHHARPNSKRLSIR